MKAWSRQRETAQQGRLLARPHAPTKEPRLGVQPLELDGPRDGLLYVPQRCNSEQPAPLALLLHGAGGHARSALGLLLPHAENLGIVLLAVDSRASTWDVIRGGYGPDVSFIDRALMLVFTQYAIDPAQIAIGGFSDGASYALSLGLTNGDLFTHIIACSPGFMAPASQQGTPKVYVSHGVHDDVLPIDRCSRRIVPQLQHAGYAVDYHEFDGPHVVPPETPSQAVSWFLNR